MGQSSTTKVGVPKATGQMLNGCRSAAAEAMEKKEAKAQRVAQVVVVSEALCPRAFIMENIPSLSSPFASAALALRNLPDFERAGLGTSMHTPCRRCCIIVNCLMERCGTHCVCHL